jgi:hypothetical protein
MTVGARDITKELEKPDFSQELLSQKKIRHEISRKKARATITFTIHLNKESLLPHHLLSCV